MICQETKWPIQRNAKIQLTVAFSRGARVFAVLIVRAQKERRKSYANVDIRPAAERLPVLNLCARDATPVPLLCARLPVTWLPILLYPGFGISRSRTPTSKNSSKIQAKTPSRRLRFIRRLNGCERPRYGTRTTVRIWNDGLLARTQWPSTMRHS